jgi:hypothetical protein
VDDTPKPRWKRRTLRLCILLLLLAVLTAAATVLFTNVSLTTDKNFARRIDNSIELANAWVVQNKDAICSRSNIPLVRMLQLCNEHKPNKTFSEIVKYFLDKPLNTPGGIWIRELDKTRPINPYILNRMIKKEIIDYKWMLYAFEPDAADITPAEMDLFSRDKWQQRQLTHQLHALLYIKNTRGADQQLEELIEHLCDRITDSLVFDIAVVDLYFQKVAFILMAGFPEKINRRWIERIMDSQLPDGGWNDRWLCFTSNRRPVFNTKTPPSNQHAMIQAMMALYLVRYEYPEHFGLEKTLK